MTEHSHVDFKEWIYKVSITVKIIKDHNKKKMSNDSNEFLCYLITPITVKILVKRNKPQ